jgi:phosphoglycerate dehydrogenase-like enzyme|tara:strand:- start:434 stop:1426 length:993 start_codon:yes stop_codon:yes gene_type:complete
VPGLKIHLHIENTSSLGPVFEASSDRVTASLERASGLENALRVTIGYDGDNLEESLSTADAVFCWDLPRDRLSDRAPNLRWIHVHGAGINHWMPFENLPRRITLTNSRGVHGKRATEYVMMAVLALNNRLPEMVTHQRSGVWQQCFSTGLAGKTLLIIGVGHIGRAVARWAKSVELNVVGIRRSGKPRRWVDQMYQTHDLLSVLPRADFVLVSAPHTRETDQLIGALELDQMKPGAGLINYSRAGLVDYEALRARLQTGRLSAVLDVFSPEPLPGESPLWQTRNLLITPHCSSDDEAYYTPRTLDLVFANAKRFIEGKPLRNRVNRKLQY